VFAIYNFARHQWYEWYWLTQDSLDRLYYTFNSKPQNPFICDEDDWICWDRNDRSCYGIKCDPYGRWHEDWPPEKW